jgi:hypothetical protein
MRRVVAFVCAGLAFAGCVRAEGDGRARASISQYDKNLERIGSAAVLAIPISALLYSSLAGDWEGDLQLLKSFATTAAVTQGMKYGIDKARPNQSGVSGSSFPSGHTSAAFSGAAYWQTRYGWEVGAPMYAASAFVAYSRVRAKKHDWVDVACGAVFGVAINYTFVSKYVEKPMDLNIEFASDAVMVSLGFAF